MIKDTGSDRTLLDHIDEIQAVAAVHRGLKDAEAGRVTPLDEAISRIRERHGFE